MIVVQGRELLIPDADRYIGKNPGAHTEIRQFKVPKVTASAIDLSGMTFYLRLQYQNAGIETVLLTKEVENDYIILTWDITLAELDAVGTVDIQIRVTDGTTIRWTTYTAALYIDRHLNIPVSYVGQLTELEQIEQDHAYMLGVVDELKEDLDYTHTAEAWAVGKRNGVDVPSSDETYHNNSKYYEEVSDAHRKTAERYANGKENGTDVTSGEGYNDNSKYYKELADDHRKTAEAYAKGTVDGTPVTSGQTGYQDNAKYYKEQIQSRLNQIDTNTSNIAVQTARIDNITQLPAGSTSGDAELMDIRVGADGVTYASAGAAVRANDSLLKSAIDEDEAVIGVHRVVLNATTHVAFSVPRGTIITIRTGDGTTLPNNRVKFYDANDANITYFATESTWGNSRTVTYDYADAAYVALNVSSNKQIMVIWYDDKDLSKNVVALTEQSVTVNENLEIISNGYYKYSQWANVSWSRTSSGNRYPYRLTNANRASFPDLLFVRAGTKVHIDGYPGQKYGYGAWTYDPNTQLYTNTLWTSQWYTDSIDWILNDDSYINISVANSTDTTEIPVNTVGVTVSIYDSKIYDHEKRLDALQEVIPSKFMTEMSTTIASVRNALTEPCLVIPMVTDIHYAPNTSVFQNFDDTIMLIKHFAKNVACDMTVNLGDNINGNSNQTLMLGYAYYMMSAFNNIGIPYLFTIGNHDTNYDPGEKFTLAETFSAFYSATKNVIYNPDTKTDYYKDIDDLGIRIVSINTQYLNAYVISTDTVSWFENIALDTDKTVILLTHQALIANQAWNNRIPSRSADIVDAVNAFINNGGTLIQFCGHAHSDYTFITPWLNICLTCGKFESVDTSTSGYQAITGYDGTLSSPSRTAGDATEQAWSVVVIRPLAKKVNVIRFGAGSDREYTYGS